MGIAVYDTVRRVVLCFIGQQLIIFHFGKLLIGLVILVGEIAEGFVEKFVEVILVVGKEVEGGSGDCEILVHETFESIRQHIEIKWVAFQTLILFIVFEPAYTHLMWHEPLYVFFVFPVPLSHGIGLQVSQVFVIVKPRKFKIKSNEVALLEALDH